MPQIKLYAFPETSPLQISKPLPTMLSAEIVPPSLSTLILCVETLAGGGYIARDGWLHEMCNARHLTYRPVKRLRWITISLLYRFHQIAWSPALDVAVSPERVR